MTTVLFYLVVAAVIGLVIFFLAVFVFGRGEQMAPLDPRTSPAELPENGVTSDDIRKVRFALGLRGYRMNDVDWTLERLGDEIDELRAENARLRRIHDQAEPGEPSAPEPGSPDEFPTPTSGMSALVLQTGADPDRAEHAEQRR